MIVVKDSANGSCQRNQGFRVTVRDMDCRDFVVPRLTANPVMLLHSLLFCGRCGSLW